MVEQRLEALDGKAMVVCMSRRICIDLYRELVRLRPDWHSEDDMQGAIKVVMTGSASDPLAWQPHIRNLTPQHHNPDILSFRLAVPVPDYIRQIEDADFHRLSPYGRACLVKLDSVWHLSQ